MNFALPTFLVATAAVAIPLIVHLLSRWQVRQMELGTMRFLQEVVHDGAQRRRIRRWLLLFTRAALMLLLANMIAFKLEPHGLWTALAPTVSGKPPFKAA